MAGFGITIGGSHTDAECNRREMARLLALIGQPDAAVALICKDQEVRETSPQLCARAGFVSVRGADEVSQTAPIMPPAAINPKAVPVAPPPIQVGAIGYSPDNKKFVFDGVAWRPDAGAVQPTLPIAGVIK